jgi:hypothetical protein
MENENLFNLSLYVSDCPQVQMLGSTFIWAGGGGGKFLVNFDRSAELKWDEKSSGLTAQKYSNPFNSIAPIRKKYWSDVESLIFLFTVT